MSARRLLPVLMLALAGSRCLCILPQEGIGRACERSNQCYSGLVCVLMEEDVPEGDRVCMPPVSFDRTDCNDAADCVRLGMPVDTRCTPEGHCACDTGGILEQLSCSYDEVPGRFSCGCVKLERVGLEQECGHPEQCESQICLVEGDLCAEQCTTDDDCNVAIPVCEDGTCVE